MNTFDTTTQTTNSDTDATARPNAACLADSLYTDADLARLHDVMLMMMKDIARFCEENDITYFANFGTAIGAIRHGGFIPWDDDIDICMPYADLCRFTDIVQREYADTYEMMSSQIDPDYPMATSRIMLRGTEFRDESLLGLPFDSGIFIDIFPLYDLAADNRAREKQIRQAWFWNKMAIVQLVAHPYIKSGGIKTACVRAATHILHGVYRLFRVPKTRFNDRSRRALLRYQGTDTGWIGFPCDTDRHWEIYRTCDIFPLRMLRFEDMELPFPKKVEMFLETIYGDFMELPPENERTAHRPVIMDFGRWDIKNIDGDRHF